MAAAINEHVRFSPCGPETVDGYAMHFTWVDFVELWQLLTA